MSESKFHFQAGGPLKSDSKLYVERKCDRDLYDNLSQMKYVKIIQARQSGKTSLAFRIRKKLIDDNYICAYINLESLARSTEEIWYREVINRLSEQVKPQIDISGFRVANSNEWRELLSLICDEFIQENKQLIIFLDECGTIPSDFSESFFCVLREIFTIREISDKFRHITFALIGVFNQADLIKNQNSSPFNIAETVVLDDFSIDQLVQLAVNIGFGEESKIISRFIKEWTSGQPYLSQKLFGKIGEIGYKNLSEKKMQEIVDEIIQEDGNHIPSICKSLSMDKNERRLLERVKSGEKIPFNPSLNKTQDRLRLLGVLVSASGYCHVRCRLYERILELDDWQKIGTNVSELVTFIAEQMDLSQIKQMALILEVPVSDSELPNPQEIAANIIESLLSQASATSQLQQEIIHIRPLLTKRAVEPANRISIEKSFELSEGGDFFEAIKVLFPSIEALINKLLVINGRSTMNYGGWKEKINDLEAMGIIPSDAAKMLEVICGRNKTMHGEFTPTNSKFVIPLFTMAVIYLRRILEYIK